MAKHLPEVDWTKVESKRIKAYKADSADYQLRIGIINKGKLPTALKQAYLVKIVREDRIELEFDTTAWVKDKPAFKVIEEKKKTPERSGRGMFDDLEGSSPTVTATKNIPFTQGGSVTEVLFTIRLYNRQELKGKASMFSTRGGVLKNKEFVIK
jgi:hypothetical protein